MSEHIQPLMLKLAPLYRVDRVFSYEEQCHLLCLARIPTHMQEIESVLAYHATLLPHERRYFPNSMLRLLQTWNELLDKIAVSQSVAAAPAKITSAERISAEGERKRIAERLAVIKGQASHTATGFTYTDKQRSERTMLLARDVLLKTKLGSVI